MDDNGQYEPEEVATPLTYGAAALLLQYGYLRSSTIVGRALADTFPTQEAWLAALNEPELQEALGSFGQLLEEIQHDLATDPDPAKLIAFGKEHYARALECIEAFAARIGVEPHDLLIVSINM